MNNPQTGALEDLPPTELFLLPAETAAELQLDTSDLRRLRHAGLGPEYFTIGHTIRYLAGDVEAWRHAHPRGIEVPTAELGSR